MRLIDADELLTAFPVDDEPMLTKSCVRMTIRRMPTVEPDVQPVRHGKWILDGKWKRDAESEWPYLDIKGKAKTEPGG